MLNRLFSEIRFRLRALFRRDRLEQELDTELSFHLQKEAEKHLATGVSPDEARRRARAAFGAVQGAKDDARDARGRSHSYTRSGRLRPVSRSTQPMALRMKNSRSSSMASA